MPTPGPLRPIARRALGAQSDDRLVRLVREGHEPAFEEIVRRYRGPLVAFAAAIVSADRAEDVVQSSLLKAHDALGRDEREIALRPWLFAIVRNGALNEVRGQAPVDELREASAFAAGPSEIAEQREDLDRLVVAMCALPDAQRRALVKRELEGVGHGEIAAQLGTTATAVRGLIFRARTGLRDAIGALLPLPIVRALLAEGAAAGAAGGGAAAGLLGGTAAKGGAAVTAAVVALGTGVALDRRGDDSGEGRGGVARAQAPDGARSQAGGGDAGSAATTTAAGRSDTSGGDNGSSGGSGESGSSGRSGDDSSGSSESGSDDAGRDDGSSGEGESGSGEREKDDDSGGGRSTAPPADDEPEVDDDEDNSGSGSGSSGRGSGGSTPDPPEVEDDSSGSSGSNSGSGSSSSGSGSGEVEVPEVEDDSSNSGSGSSNSGSGSGSEDDED